MLASADFGRSDLAGVVAGLRQRPLASDGVAEIGDLYSGLGGSSTGMVRAARELDVPFRLTGVNHWDVAIASYSLEHPYAQCFKMEIEDAPASTIFPRGRLDIMWASPECVEHSYANGGKSINDQRRANAFSIPRLAGEIRPQIIIVENVPPFIKWGPTEPARYRNGRIRRDKTGQPIMRPILSRKGETFREWFADIEAAGPGYRGEWRMLNAADYGEAQSRIRFIAVFTAPGVTYEWPEPTNDRTGANGLPLWVGAGSCIDYSLPMESVFEREKPLSDNTIERAAAGIPLVLESPDLVAACQVVLRRHADIARLEAPAPTICAGGRHLSLAKISMRPYVCRNQTHNTPAPDDAAAPCVTTAHGGGLFVAQPNLLVLGQHGGGIARTASMPASTIATAGYVRIFAPYFKKVHRSLSKRKGRATMSGARAPKNAGGGVDVTILGRAPGSGVIIEVGGTPYIFDLLWRMLTRKELLQLQGLKPGYALTGTKTEQTTQIGNAVPEKLAYALTRRAFIAIGYGVSREVAA